MQKDRYAPNDMVGPGPRTLAFLELHDEVHAVDNARLENCRRDNGNALSGLCALVELFFVELFFVG